MMCDPCFMDANQVGFVHELSWEDVKKLLDDAITIKPRRQLSVQFSGGEPTLSPHFLDAVRYATKVGYKSIQAATNGIEFAKSQELCRQAAEAGLRYAYLQFDGIGNAANSHRRVGNLFDVKLQAIENLHEAGVDCVPVITIVNGINNEQVGRVIQFAIDNPKKISVCAFQPVSFTGRDEEVTDERRQAAAVHPLPPGSRREGPAGHRRAACATGSRSPSSERFSDWSDQAARAGQGLGTGLRAGAIPNCGTGMAMHGGQGDEGGGAAHRVLQRGPPRQGRPEGHRLGPGQVSVRPGHGPGGGPELRPLPDARNTSA